MSGGTGAHEGYSLIMTDPLKQGYKSKRKGKEKGDFWNIIWGRNTQEKSKGLEHHSKVR